MSNELYHAVKWKHPDAKMTARDGVITSWDDVAPEPDEATLIAEWTADPTGKPAQDAAEADRTSRRDAVLNGPDAQPATLGMLRDLGWI